MYLTGIVIIPLYYLEYSSTMLCSAIGISMSSLEGRLRIFPSSLSVSMLTHLGVVMIMSLSCLNLGELWLFSLTATTSPSLSSMDGMFAFFPFTRKWPWETSCLASLLVAAKPILYTTLSNLLSSMMRRFSPVLPGLWIRASISVISLFWFINITRIL